MRLAIIAATGPTGRCLMQQALEAGHTVVALVRSPEKIESKHEHLEVKKVNVLSEDSLAEAMEGCQAVFSCLGATELGFWRTITIYSESIKAITAAVRRKHIKKLVVMSAAGNRSDSSDPWYMGWVFKPMVSLFIGPILKNIAVMEDYLENECRDLEFTTVRPPQLTDDELSADELLVLETQYLSEGKWTLPRHNVAQFMLSCLNTDSYNNKMVAIALRST